MFALPRVQQVDAPGHFRQVDLERREADAAMKCPSLNIEKRPPDWCIRRALYPDLVGCRVGEGAESGVLETRIWRGAVEA